VYEVGVTVLPAPTLGSDLIAHSIKAWICSYVKLTLDCSNIRGDPVEDTDRI